MNVNSDAMPARLGPANAPAGVSSERTSVHSNNVHRGPNGFTVGHGGSVGQQPTFTSKLLHMSNNLEKSDIDKLKFLVKG